MYLYLIQHGDAVNKEQDPARPLSTKGTADARKIASFLALNMDIKVEQVFESGKLRATQTARIFAENLGVPENKITVSDGLAPKNDPSIWASRLRDITDDTMLAGHLPHLANLAAFLICGEKATEAKGPMVNFKMGGVVCLRNEEGKWAVEWMMVPEMLKEAEEIYVDK